MNLPGHQDTLWGITWEQAATKVDSLNTIAGLVFHIDYYISAVSKVLDGGSLDASDQYSFDLTPITSQQDLDKLLQKI